MAENHTQKWPFKGGKWGYDFYKIPYKSSSNFMYNWSRPTSFGTYRNVYTHMRRRYGLFPT